jgi:hypothetical protein
MSPVCCDVPAKWIKVVLLDRVFRCRSLHSSGSISNTTAQTRKAPVGDELKGRRVAIREFSMRRGIEPGP